VPITGEDLNRWVADVEYLVAEFLRCFEGRYGYSPDVNGVVRATDADGKQAVARFVERGIAGDLLEFYSVVREVSLPDLDNGIFVHSPDVVIDGIDGEQPIEVLGAISGRITVFASDGGGGLIVQLAEDGRIYKLRWGILVRQRFEVPDDGLEVFAVNVWGLLERIREDLAQAVSGS
jgi:hypothetical protein